MNDYQRQVNREIIRMYDREEDIRAENKRRLEAGESVYVDTSCASKACIVSAKLDINGNIFNYETNAYHYRNYDTPRYERYIKFLLKYAVIYFMLNMLHFLAIVLLVLSNFKIAKNYTAFLILYGVFETIYFVQSIKLFFVKRRQMLYCYCSYIFICSAMIFISAYYDISDNKYYNNGIYIIILGASGFLFLLSVIYSIIFIVIIKKNEREE